MTGARPAVVVLVAGTGTDVGKTWVSARLLEAWRGAGLSVAARKPAQSFAAGTGPTDAEVLAAATGEDPDHRLPAGPFLPGPPGPAHGRRRSRSARRPPWPIWSANSTGRRRRVDVGLVETAGGVRSPQADDGDVIDLVGGHRPRPRRPGGRRRAGHHQRRPPHAWAALVHDRLDGAEPACRRS